MKVYALPKELTATIPQHDYVNQSYDEWSAAEDAHKETIKQWLVDHGYTGKNTGRILQMPVADGYAEYMLAEGSKSFLLHLPYCDGYDDPNVNFLPKKEVLRRIKGRETIAKLFSSAA